MGAPPAADGEAPRAAVVALQRHLHGPVAQRRAEVLLVHAQHTEHRNTLFFAVTRFGWAASRRRSGDVENRENALNPSTLEAQFVLQFLVRGHLRQKMPIPSAVPKGA